MSLIKKHLAQMGVTPSADNDGANNANSNQSGSDNGDAGGADSDDDNDAGAAGSQADDGAGANGGANKDTPGDDQGSGAPDDIDDAKLLAILKKRGIEAASIDALKPQQADKVLTDEEKEQAAKRRTDQIRMFALQNEIVSSTELDAFARESERPASDLAFAIYKRNKLAEYKADGTPEEDRLSDEDLLAEFKDANFLFADPTDPKRKAAEKRLEAEKENYLQETYSSIYEMEDKYEEHESANAQRATYENTLNDAFGVLGNQMDFDFYDEVTKQTLKYPVKFNDTEIAAVKKLYEEDNLFNVFRTQADKQVIAEAIKGTLMTKYFNKITGEIATAHANAVLDAHKKGRRAIPVNSNTGNESAAGKETSPMLKKLFQRNGVTVKQN